MTEDYPIASTSLAFFGQMSASVSHEIKNTLAIINENAGLLSDLVLMARNGGPLPVDRLERLAGAVSKQVRRTDAIVRNLNRFAHSADDWIGTCDLSDMLDLVSALSARILNQKGVEVEQAGAGAGTTVVTCPFLLQTLVGRVLQFAADRPAAGKTICLAVKKSAGGKKILITGLDTAPYETVTPFPGQTETALLDCLGGNCRHEVENGRLVIRLPDDVTLLQDAGPDD